MAKPWVYVAVILFSSLILAIGWVDISLGSKRIDLGPLGVPVSFHCAEGMTTAHGIDFTSMNESKRAILTVKKHVQSVEIEVAEGQGDRAGYLVSVVMNSGNRVQTRMLEAQWNGLDMALSQSIHRCVDEFMALRHIRSETGAPILLTI